MYFDFEEKQPRTLPRIKTPRLDEMRSHYSLSVIQKQPALDSPHPLGTHRRLAPASIGF